MGNEQPYKCGDCWKKTGEYHADNCDIERCPKCGGQLLSCDCKLPNIAINGSFLMDSEGKKYYRHKVGVSADEDFGCH